MELLTGSQKTSRDASLRILRCGCRFYSIRSVLDVEQEFECSFRLYISWIGGKIDAEWAPEFYFLDAVSAPYTVDGPVTRSKLLDPTTQSYGYEYQVRIEKNDQNYRCARRQMLR